MNRLMELPLRHLSESDRKWLENRIHDKRPEVAGAARGIYREWFSVCAAERMEETACSTFEFEIHTEVCQECGDWEAVGQQFGVFRKERAIAFLDRSSGSQNRK